MTNSLRSHEDPGVVSKQALLLREHRNNLTQTPLIPIFPRVQWATEAAIFPIFKADAAFWGRQVLR